MRQRDGDLSYKIAAALLPVTRVWVLYKHCPKMPISMSGVSVALLFFARSTAGPASTKTRIKTRYSASKEKSQQRTKRGAKKKT
jgi:hypothetical protein